MIKFKRFILLFLCLFMISGCDIYVYNFDDTNSETSNGDDFSNLGGNSSGTTIVNPETNYKGFIDDKGTIALCGVRWSPTGPT